MSTSTTELFETLQAPEGLDKGIYEGYVLRSVPEVQDGDFVFASGNIEENTDNVTHLEPVKSVA